MSSINNRTQAIQHYLAQLGLTVSLEEAQTVIGLVTEIEIAEEVEPTFGAYSFSELLSEIEHYASIRVRRAQWECSSGRGSSHPIYDRNLWELRIKSGLRNHAVTAPALDLQSKFGDEHPVYLRKTWGILMEDLGLIKKIPYWEWVRYESLHQSFSLGLNYRMMAAKSGYFESLKSDSVQSLTDVLITLVSECRGEVSLEAATAYFKGTYHKDLAEHHSDIIPESLLKAI